MSVYIYVEFMLVTENGNCHWYRVDVDSCLWIRLDMDIKVRKINGVNTDTDKSDMDIFSRLRTGYGF